MNDRRRKFLLGLFLIAGSVAVVVYVTQDSYGTVGSLGYDFATALFSACNRHDAETIAELASMVDAAASEGELSEQELAWLRGILADADAGDWQSAASESRRLLEAQVIKP